MIGYAWDIPDDDLKHKYFRHCHFKGGGSTTVSNQTTYTQSPEEQRLTALQGEYINRISPNAYALNDLAMGVLKDSLGTVQVDFNGMNNAAQQQIASANQGMAQLANGQLPLGYQQAMQDAIASTLQNTMGQTLNSAANRGVLNSSVTGQAMNDISKNAANATAENFLQSSNQLGNIYANQKSMANAPITTAAAAQEAAQNPAFNLWNASLGLNGATTGALAAASGKGTTNSISTSSGGKSGGLFGGLFG